MSRCRHCGQGALMADYVGPICPDCIEEGYAEHAPTKPIAEAKTAPADPLADERVKRLVEALENAVKWTDQYKWAAPWTDDARAALAAIEAQP